MAIKEEAGTPKRKGRKGYVTTTFTGDDIRKARGLLDKQAKESAAKINEEKLTWKCRVRNCRGQTKYVSEQSEQQITTMQRSWYKKGPRSSRPTFSMGGHIETKPDGTKVFVRD